MSRLLTFSFLTGKKQPKKHHRTCPLVSGPSWTSLSADWCWHVWPCRPPWSKPPSALVMRNTWRPWQGKFATKRRESSPGDRKTRMTPTTTRARRASRARSVAVGLCEFFLFYFLLLSLSRYEEKTKTDMVPETLKETESAVSAPTFAAPAAPQRATTSRNAIRAGARSGLRRPTARSTSAAATLAFAEALPSSAAAPSYRRPSAPSPRVPPTRSPSATGRAGIPSAPAAP
jgi:hypothetical protein